MPVIRRAEIVEKLGLPRASPRLRYTLMLKLLELLASELLGVMSSLRWVFYRRV
jgi:hypothetical protein